MLEFISEKVQSSNGGLERRSFLQSLGGGLLVVLTLDKAAAAQESGSAGRQGGHSLPENVGAWLHIAPDGQITAFTGEVEVGQNIRTSLTQAAADELRCDPGSINSSWAVPPLRPWTPACKIW